MKSATTISVILNIKKSSVIQIHPACINLNKAKRSDPQRNIFKMSKSSLYLSVDISALHSFIRKIGQVDKLVLALLFSERLVLQMFLT